MTGLMYMDGFEKETYGRCVISKGTAVQSHEKIVTGDGVVSAVLEENSDDLRSVYFGSLNERFLQ